MRSQLVTQLLENSVRNQEEQRTSNKQYEKIKMKKDSSKKWVDFLLMKESEKSKYGTLLKGFVYNFLWGVTNTQITLL